MPCPYLSGRVEQQLFTELSGAQALDTFDVLSQGGFRRSHHIIYKPACTGCTACIPVRIPVSRFKSSRAWRKINNRNADLVIVNVGTRITEEQYELFKGYTNRRHGDGEMAKMSRRDYAAMVLSSPVDTVLVEFRNGGEKLIAVCLMDRLAGGLSAVYADPDEDRRSLGSYVILWMIEEAKRQDLDHVYLGYWVMKVKDGLQDPLPPYREFRSQWMVGNRGALFGRNLARTYYALGVPAPPSRPVETLT